MVLAEDFVQVELLIRAVILQENPQMNPEAVGDKHLRNKAYGLLQVRQPYLTDVNRIAGKEKVRRRWGKDVLTLMDMKDRDKAEWAFLIYISHYGKRYTKLTGKNPTVEVYARIHNGGPDGWRKKTTVQYGRAVVRNYKK